MANGSRYAIIGRIQGGWYGLDFTGGSASGGLFESYVQHAHHGAVVFDASAAPFEACARLSISGPMLKATLYGHKPFRSVEALDRMLGCGGLEDGFRVLGERALAGDGVGQPRYGSFDEVGWAEYRRLLETELPIGTVRFGRVTVSRGLATVAWENGGRDYYDVSANGLQP
jgi:hypothetical protein